MKSDPLRRWPWAILVFGVVVGAQLALVAAIGTDVPFHDQWDVEGRWFYPALREGHLHLADFFRPHSEHRIVWTHLLNYALFVVNGGWDPLVQLVAGAVLRAGAAAALADGFIGAAAPRWRPAIAVGIAAALAAWMAVRRRALARVILAAWSAFLVVGWIGLSTEMTRRILIPRARDRDAPVRVIRQFHRSRDPAVFDGQPRLLVPHPNLVTVQAVLTDARLQGALPPSLQPGEPMGPLSRGARAVLFRREARQ